MDVNTNRDQLQPIELKYKMRGNWKILLLLASYLLDWYSYWDWISSMNEVLLRYHGNRKRYIKKNVLDPIYKWILLLFMLPAKWLHYSWMCVFYSRWRNTVPRIFFFEFRYYYFWIYIMYLKLYNICSQKNRSAKHEI